MNQMTDGLATIADCKVSFMNVIDNDDKSTTYTSCTFANDDRSAADGCFFQPIATKIGDLAYKAVVLGKEDMSSHWCNFCNLDRSKWADLSNNGNKSGLCQHLWPKHNEMRRTSLRVLLGWESSQCLFSRVTK
jgi:hypothetical protein